MPGLEQGHRPFGGSYLPRNAGAVRRGDRDHLAVIRREGREHLTWGHGDAHSRYRFVALIRPNDHARAPQFRKNITRFGLNLVDLAAWRAEQDRVRANSDRHQVAPVYLDHLLVLPCRG